MRKFTILLLISFIGIGLYAQNMHPTKNYDPIKKFTEAKITKPVNSINTKSTNAYVGESFEGTTFPPTGWTLLNPTGGTGWSRQVAGVALPNWSGALAPACPTNGGSAYAIANFSTGSSGANNDQWLISPSFSVTSGDSLKFWVMLFATNYEDSIDVRISTTTNTSASSFSTLLLTLDTNTIVGQTFTHYSFDLSSYAGQTIYVAFREHVMDNVTNGSLFAIDMVQMGTSTAPDVAVQSVDVPYFNGVGVAMNPLATVSNIGVGTQNFTATMTITPGSYSSTQNVNNLASGGNQQVTFGPWTPSAAGTYLVTVTTTLAGDGFPGNDVDTMTVAALNNLLWDNADIVPDNYGLVSMRYLGYSSPDSMTIAADDFIVPPLTTWTVSKVFTQGFPSTAAATITINRFGIHVLSDNNGQPGSVLFTDSVALVDEGDNLGSTQTFTLNNPFTITPGKYWLSVFAEYDTATTLAVCRWNWAMGTKLVSDTAMLSNTTRFLGGAFPFTNFTAIGLAEKSLYFLLFGTSITGITENSVKNIEIYPNPSNGSLYISNAENASIVVYNLLGEIVKSSKCYSAFNTLNLSDLSNGSYIVKVVADKNTVTKKINIVK